MPGDGRDDVEPPGRHDAVEQTLGGDLDLVAMGEQHVEREAVVDREVPRAADVGRQRATEQQFNSWTPAMPNRPPRSIIRPETECDLSAGRRSSGRRQRDAA